MYWPLVAVYEPLDSRCAIHSFAAFVLAGVEASAAGAALGAAGAAAAGAAGCAGLLPVSTPLGHLFAQMPQALHLV